MRRSLAVAACVLFASHASAGEAAQAGAERSPVYRTELAEFEFPGRRPRLEHTAEEIGEIKHSMAGRDLREHAWVKQAQPWLEKPLYFFEEGYDPRYYTTGRNCPYDAATLAPVALPDGTTEAKCPQCNRIYRGEPQKAAARAMINGQQALSALALARAYALTEDLRYARRAAEILLGFAGRYQQWGGGGHAVLYHLRESYGFLVPLTTAYDYIYASGALSVEDRQKIERDFFRVAAEFYSKWADNNGRLNNRGAIHNHSVMCIGVAIADKKFLDQALNSPHSGFHTLAANLFLADGLCWEGFGYHSYTVSGLSPIAEMAYRVGINVYRDPAYRRIFTAPLKALLPGEELMPEEYRIACRRFTELGEPMEYPFGTQREASGQPSHNFDHFGFGVLRSGEGEDQLQLSMEYGKEAMFMGHAPAVKFSLGLYANGRLLTPKGAASYGSELCGGWSRRALAHNSIAVDDRDQSGRTKAGPDPAYSQRKLIAFESAPRVQVLRASDDEVYPGVTLDRTLFLANGYVVDFAGARAESGEHRFDLCYRLFGALSSELPFQTRKDPLGAGYGYQYLTNMKSARTDQPWSVQWRQAEDSALRLSIPGGPATEVIACNSPGNTDQDERVEALVARRWGQGAVFAALWEPCRDKPPVSQVRALPVRSDEGRMGDSEGVGLEVVNGRETGQAWFLASYTPGKKRFGDIELDGSAAAGRWSDSQKAPDYAQLVRGVLLRRGAHSIEASAPATLYVQQLPSDRLFVKTGTGSAGKLTITGRLARLVEVHHEGRKLEVEAAPGRTLTWDAAQNSSYQVSGLDAWECIRLECTDSAGAEAMPESAAAPAPLAAAPKPVNQAPLADDGSLTGKNKVANGGFEVNPHTHPGVSDAWDIRSSYHFANFQADFAYDGEMVHSGKHSMKILAMNWANEATRDGWIEQKAPGAGANKTYTLSAWVRASLEPTRVRLCLHGFNPKWGADFDGGVSPKFDIGTEWKRITWTRTFGPEITDVYVMVKREHQVLGGDLWIDDVQLEEGGAATEFASDAWTQAAQRKP